MGSLSGSAAHGDAAPRPTEDHAAGAVTPTPGGHALGLPAGDEPGAGRNADPPAAAPLEPAPRPRDLWDVMQAQVDRAFADFLGGDYGAPRWGEVGSGPGAS